LWALSSIIQVISIKSGVINNFIGFIFGIIRRSVTLEALLSEVDDVFVLIIGQILQDTDQLISVDICINQILLSMDDSNGAEFDVRDVILQGFDE
jgi:hypothetical protein